jgi:hypothetical protein
MWWVFFVKSKHNPLARTYGPMINNFLHELSWHIKEYLDTEQLLA